MAHQQKLKVRARARIRIREIQLKPYAVGAVLLLAQQLLAVLEKTMSSHVLLEFPLLVGVGVWLGSRWQARLLTFRRLCNKGGIAGILLATFTLAFWMIPRWLDASVVNIWLGVAKYLSLVFLVGVPLAWSWPLLHFIARGVVKIEFLTMLFRLGWLYLISPNRLCNSYLLTDQMYLGYGFLLVGLSLGITWLIPAFIDNGQAGRATVQW